MKEVKGLWSEVRGKPVERVIWMKRRQEEFQAEIWYCEVHWEGCIDLGGKGEAAICR